MVVLAEAAGIKAVGGIGATGGTYGTPGNRWQVWRWEMVSVEKEVQMELRENSYSVIGGGGTGGGGGGGGYGGSNGCGWAQGGGGGCGLRVERLVEYLMIQTVYLVTLLGRCD